MVNHLYGGDGDGEGLVYGPAVVAQAYKALACGADRITAAKGEVAVCLNPGSPSTFGHWVVGPVDEVVDFLRGYAVQQGEPRWADLACQLPTSGH